jgi:AraC-like DNA-binding protein
MSETGAGNGALATGGPNGWIRRAPDEPGCERIEAYFAGRAYEPHRHDTYAIGLTLTGVQSFNYRGERRVSLPGATMVLHPDELHDGEAGDAAGFRYRMLYIEPSQLQKALGGRPLPYVPGGISHDPDLHRATAALLEHLDGQLDGLEYEDAVYDLAWALERAGGSSSNGSTASIDYCAAEQARARLDDGLELSVSLAELEAAAGRDRWQLSRDFRRLYGTSPHRYLVMRRLDRVRAELRDGATLAAAAATAGFADQAHMSRHFKRAYGMTPGNWMRLLAA